MQKAKGYVHGYGGREALRLRDQGRTLTQLLHADTFYPAGSRVLEAGCGVGAQTVAICANSPKALINSVDISEKSVEAARRAARAAGLKNIEFAQADIFSLPFEKNFFDHIFVCFVLEHLADPVAALKTLKKHLKRGGTITVIEGDHGSAYFYPDSAEARAAIACQVELQRRAGGNALIGRELFPLLKKAGFADISVSARTVYADASRPELREGFVRKTFTAMIEGVGETAVSAGLAEKPAFARGIKDLKRTAVSDGVFNYTFFKALAVRA